MDCQGIKEYLYQSIDGQLDSQDSLLVKEHLYSCPLCNLKWGEEKKIDSIIRQNIPKERASYLLKEAVINKIEEFQKVNIFYFASPILKPALVAILVILLVTIPVIFKHAGSFPVFSESISRHIKCLQGGLPIEISSSNPHDIEKWFQGKLDFAISVPDLSKNGVNLLGARLCHLKDRKVAYIMYEKNGHNISTFIIDTKGLNIPRSKKINMDRKILLIKSERGYQSILCFKKDNDIGCIFVSELPEDELMKIIT